jgi:hypothetical protein
LPQQTNPVCDFLATDAVVIGVYEQKQAADNQMAQAIFFRIHTNQAISVVGLSTQQRQGV